MSSRQSLSIRMLRSIQSYFPMVDSIKSTLRWNYYRLTKNVAEPEFAVLRAILPSRPICIDIGANRGLTIQSLLNICPLATIVGFEPNTILVKQIARRFASNLNVKIINAGIGEREGSLLFFIPKYRNYVYDCLSSTDRSSAESWLSDDTCWRFDSTKLSLIEVKIDIIPLDNLNLIPSFIKIDVQGTNMDVILGGLGMIELHKPIILIESPEDCVRDILARFGYIEYHTRSGRLYLGKGRINSLFIPSSIPVLP